MTGEDRTRSTAAVEGPWWGSRSSDWAELWGSLADPAREAVAEATRVSPGTRLLDVGCGSGEFCLLAAARGATVSGLDAAGGMIGISRQRLPDADLRVGALERLPWPDDSFDVVTAFNSLQFAADLDAAFAEAGRVVRPGGLVAVCNWERDEHCEVNTVYDALRVLAPPSEDPPPASRPAVREPGVLEELARRAGLSPRSSGDVEAPLEVPDQAKLERAFRVMHAERIGVTGDAARGTIVGAAAPFRRPDGSYRFENRFRYIVAEARRQ